MTNYIEKQLPLYNKERVEFVYSTIVRNIDRNKKYKILDVGCGTGELFTIPLAVRLQEFRNIEILGIDIHCPSIERARGHIDKTGIEHLAFECKTVNEIEDTYNCICLMAVLEHLINPEAMLVEIRKRLRENGFFILYIPNGYGPYEMECALFRKLLFILKPTYIFLRKIRRIIYQKSEGKESSFVIKETLNEANNVHIQFFKLKGIKKMLRENGFLIRSIFKTRLLSGPFSSIFLERSKILENINQQIAKQVPAIIVSDWTFVCKVKR